ncbi:TadE-like protein [Acetitomaculum ruminis DSM 5522]|uniref:TadE-like protein n=1 Tax=Acetitomaculum ruminis DSM 5522 TaxID=1120918 RepID=A0A1I0YBI1_9FIRM|nr:TadE family protein [Acetitomaculum ruminis]SFB09850.1 TadE-like protein [Acetitomaculum ruminis DSM 5522]
MLINIINKNKQISPHFKRKASLTVESSLVMPLFLFTILLFIYIGEYVSLQSEVTSAAYGVATEISEYSSLLKKANVSHDKIPAGILTTAYAKNKIIKAVGENRIKYFVKNEKNGMKCQMNISDDIDIKVNFYFKTGVYNFFGLNNMKVSCRAKSKAWTGKIYRIKDDDELVYVAENGVVYHRLLSCTFIKLSVRPVLFSDISNARNRAGGKYYPCEKCKMKKIENGIVFITNDGSRYHTFVNCSEIKRTIHSVPLGKVQGKGICSRCGME